MHVHQEGNPVVISLLLLPCQKHSIGNLGGIQIAHRCGCTIHYLQGALGAHVVVCRLSANCSDCNLQIERSRNVNPNLKSAIRSVGFPDTIRSARSPNRSNCPSFRCSCAFAFYLSSCWFLSLQFLVSIHNFQQASLYVRATFCYMYVLVNF